MARTGHVENTRSESPVGRSDYLSAMPIRSARASLVAALVVAGALVAACGDSTGGSPTTVTLPATTPQAPPPATETTQLPVTSPPDTSQASTTTGVPGGETITFSADGVLSPRDVAGCDDEWMLNGGWFAPPALMLLSCDGIVASVDIRSGVVERIGDLDFFDPADDRSGAYYVHYFDNQAEGLTEPTWGATIVYFNFATGDDWSFDIAANESGTVRADRERRQVLYVGRDRVVTLNRDYDDPVEKTGPNDRLDFHASDGTIVASHWLSDLGIEPTLDPDQLSMRDLFVFARYGSVAAFDLRTGEPILVDADSPGPPEISLSYCSANDQMFLSGTRGDTIQFRIGRDGSPVITEFSRPTVDQDLVGSTEGDLFVDGFLYRNKADDVSFVGFDGTVLWTLPGTIVSSTYIVGDWLVMRNRSDDTFVVDPTTGAEAVIAPELEDAILAAREFPPIRWDDGGMLDLRGVEGGVTANYIEADTFCR